MNSFCAFPGSDMHPTMSRFDMATSVSNSYSNTWETLATNVPVGNSLVSSALGWSYQIDDTIIVGGGFPAGSSNLVGTPSVFNLSSGTFERYVYPSAANWYDCFSSPIYRCWCVIPCNMGFDNVCVLASPM